ncbi:hypothetical protein PYW07_004876 [Mythimna separata]|uniref:STING ligand-binding domain-containing protein n=1 Tax=Mythimna separata TaxID=271217 RepID=A0AAD7YDC3_MYTSE|nr:hypothetical protein PYW07_004876 [Mythimna separata]
MDQIHIYIMYVLLAIGVTFGSPALYSDDKHQWMLNIARYILYILTIQGARVLCTMCYDMVHKRFKPEQLKATSSLYIVMYITCLAILVSNEQWFYVQDFPLIFIAYLIVEYPEIMDKTETFIKYGVGMACNFYEGYLMIVIPSDGGKFGGFIQNIEAFESREGVVVPVKKLFIVITKSLYSPPDLQLFNKTNRDDLAMLEACSVRIGGISKSLDDLEKDIAGVKNRSYKNCAYRIYRPSGLPVSLVAECATPLHTLYKVIENKELYGDLGEVNVDEVCADFCTTLKNILARSSECRDRVELVYYDDTDPESNLADVLLDRIRQLEPNFEELISVRR